LLESGLRFLCTLLAASALAATLTSVERKQNLDSFEHVWTTIRNTRWDNSLDGPEWQRVHDELRPKVERALSLAEARKVMQDMIGRLHLTHFGIIPNDLYSQLHEGGSANIDVRVIDGKALIVTGEHAGWEVLHVEEPIARVGKLYENSTLRDMMLARAVQAAAAGRADEISDGRGHAATIHPDDQPRRGEPVQFGNLPTQYVWIEAKTIGTTGYVAFNMFLDLERVIAAISSAVSGCRDCKAFVVDLRGNPGGIGGMAMGVAGFFVSKPDQRLGVMETRQGALKFFINPRQPRFDGPLAILVDGLSASTSEIFAGGLQDLGRARIFGTRTAGAALPSVIEKLPNGDGFQYAIANYTSEGGKVLEGRGVIPDVVVAPTRAALLAGHDPVLEAALSWCNR
jgi:carboxyl-terminal processing protease